MLMMLTGGRLGSGPRPPPAPGCVGASERRSYYSHYYTTTSVAQAVELPLKQLPGRIRQGVLICPPSIRTTQAAALRLAAGVPRCCSSMMQCVDVAMLFCGVVFACGVVPCLACRFGLPYRTA